MKLGMWDYLTFLSFFVIGIGGLATIVFVLGLPGRIARARKHPEADAVDMMGWVGFMAVVPWIQALLWAFKPTDVIDIRRFPREEQASIDEEARQYAEDHMSRRAKKKAEREALEQEAPDAKQGPTEDSSDSDSDSNENT